MAGSAGDSRGCVSGAGLAGETGESRREEAREACGRSGSARPSCGFLHRHKLPTDFDHTLVWSIHAACFFHPIRWKIHHAVDFWAPIGAQNHGHEFVTETKRAVPTRTPSELLPNPRGSSHELPHFVRTRAFRRRPQPARVASKRPGVTSRSVRPEPSPVPHYAWAESPTHPSLSSAYIERNDGLCIRTSVWTTGQTGWSGPWPAGLTEAAERCLGSGALRVVFGVPLCTHPLCPDRRHA
jgi:hypothetical protein